MFIVAEIILKNNFRTLSAAEIGLILFQFQTSLHVKYNSEIIGNHLTFQYFISHVYNHRQWLHVK